MKLLYLSFLSILVSITGYGQFHYTFTSTPDSARVEVNGEKECYTPCRVSYFWKNAENGKMMFNVSSEGFKPWTDSILKKPMEFDLKESLTLERDLPDLKIDSNSALVAFDRLAANIKGGTKVGEYHNSDDEIEPINWQGSVKLGSEEFHEKFYNILTNTGFNTPVSEEMELFSNSSGESKRLPRFMIGARLVKYDVHLNKSDERDFDSGDIVGRTLMELEWEILDRSNDKVVEKIKTKGVGNYRNKYGRTIADNGLAFEDALVNFLQESRLVELVNNAEKPTFEGLSEPDSTISSRTLKKVELPEFDNNSDMIARVNESCVTIITDGGHGSGFVISNEGLVLTASHVVQGVNKISIRFSSNIKLNANVLASDNRNDVALLKIEGSGFPALPISLESDPKIGQDVMTIGTPAEVDLGQSVSKGIVSGKRRAKGRVYTQLDMAVSLGNSGGPLINSRGQVIGVVQSKIIEEGVEGIGFAVPIDRALKVLNLSIEDTK